MFDLTAVTAIATVLLFVATVLLFFATWRAATAAKQNARIAAREFQLLRRPLVAVKWRAHPIVEVAHLYVKVVISADDDEADEETWCGTSVLDFDTKQQRYEVHNTRPRMRRLSLRTRGPRSRMVDPVLGAWQRFCDSVQ